VLNFPMNTPPNDTPLVKPHPRGGFTHAWPLVGTARIYTGHFNTAPEAWRAARGAVNPRVRAALIAAQPITQR